MEIYFRLLLRGVAKTTRQAGTLSKIRQISDLKDFLMNFYFTQIQIIYNSLLKIFVKAPSLMQVNGSQQQWDNANISIKQFSSSVPLCLFYSSSLSCSLSDQQGWWVIVCHGCCSWCRQGSPETGWISNKNLVETWSL